MRQHLFASIALGGLALGGVASEVAAAPVATGVLTAPITTRMQPVFFLRCGLFGERCRYRHRAYRDGYWRGR